MNKYQIIISNSIIEDIQQIADYITSLSFEDHANSYALNLLHEIDTLSYMADVLPDCDLPSVKQYHPKAKQMTTHNRKWTIIFHTQLPFVVVDKIIPSSLVI